MPRMGADLEQPIREEVMRRFANSCECRAEARVRDTRHGDLRVDVLCRPRDAALHDLTVAIEVKVCRIAGDGTIGRWIKQASDYVHAVPIDCDWPPVAAAFMWLIGVQLQESERERIAGMVMLAQHFRVGHAHHSIRGERVMLTFGPSADVYHEGRGDWLPLAPTLLKGSRINGGTRKKLAEYQ
jgi:hypothetical protein